MPRMEILIKRFRLCRKVKQIRTPLEFISPVGIKIIHQDIFIAIIQLEDTRPFNHNRCIRIGIQIGKILFPRSFQRFTGCLLNPVFKLLSFRVFGISFIKEVIKSVFVNNITINTAKLGTEQQCRFFFKSRKIFIGIRAIKIQFVIVMEAYRKIYEIFTGFMVIKYLRRPYPFHIPKLLRV